MGYRCTRFFLYENVGEKKKVSRKGAKEQRRKEGLPQKAQIVHRKICANL